MQTVTELLAWINGYLEANKDGLNKEQVAAILTKINNEIIYNPPQYVPIPVYPCPSIPYNPITYPTITFSSNT